MSEESSDWKARKEAMYAAAKRATTTAELADLVDRLRSEEHDYNSIVHACAAAALAACRVVDRGPHGGITGFQAGAIFWEFWSEWLASEEERTLGARILTWSNALYPQYRGTFAAPTIPTDTWQAMQSRALELLSKHADDDFVSANVRAHWRRIADGKPPFGLRVERTP